MGRMMILMPDRPIVIPPGGGKRICSSRWLATSDDSPRFIAGVIEVAPGMHVERHTHDDEDDAFYVLEGEITFLMGEDEEVRGGPETFVLAPPGVVHGFRNDTGETARIFNVHAPAGFDRRMEHA